MINQTLDLWISMVTVILAGSLMLGSSYEWYASWINKRGNHLFESIHKMFSGNRGNDFISLLYNHPEIHLLKHKGELPSYISKAMFAHTLLDVIIDDYKQQKTIITYANFIPETEDQNSFIQKNQLLYEAIENLEYSHIKRMLLTHKIDKNDADYYEKISEKLADWFENYQERTTGWYKRSVQRQSFFAALIFAVFVNFNIIDVYFEMKNNIQLQQMTIQLGEKMVSEGHDSLQKKSFETWNTHIDSLKDYKFPFGYKISKETKILIENGHWTDVVFQADFSFFKELWHLNFKWFTIPGWLLTAMLLTIQSSFWFEILVKMFNIRKTGVKPDQQK